MQTYYEHIDEYTKDQKQILKNTGYRYGTIYKDNDYLIIYNTSLYIFLNNKNIIF